MKKPDPSCKVENTKKKSTKQPDKEYEEWANTVSEEWWGESDKLCNLWQGNLPNRLRQIVMNKDKLLSKRIDDVFVARKNSRAPWAIRYWDIVLVTLLRKANKIASANYHLN